MVGVRGKIKDIPGQSVIAGLDPAIHF